MNIYIYQVTPYEYGAGFVKEACEKQGRIVEVLPMRHEKDARYAISRGSNHGNVHDRVVALAHFAKELIFEAGKLENPVVVTTDEWNLAIQERQRVFDKQKENIRQDYLKKLREVEDRMLEQKADAIDYVGKQRDRAISEAREDCEKRIEEMGQRVMDDLLGQKFWARVRSALKIIRG